MDDRNYELERNIWRLLYSIMLVLFIAAKRDKSSDDTKEVEVPTQTIEQTFDAGEHIISVPIDNPKKEIQTYEYHDGYEVIDIENKYILYVNDEPVICKGELTTDEEVVFLEFGEPVEKDKKNTESKTYKLVPQEQLTTEE